MKYLFLTFLSLCLQTGIAQNINPADSLYLNIVIPEEDTVEYNLIRYRIAANTHPDAKAFINDEEVRVYSSGAFVGMVEHSRDNTEIKLTVTLNGNSITKTRWLIRAVEEDYTPPEGRVITNRMQMPEDDIWLNTGEVLVVQFQGSPGQETRFNIDGFKDDIPMREIAPEYAGGQEGVYRGRYVIKPDDIVENAHITFKMRRSMLADNKLQSRATVSLNGLPRVAQVSVEGAYLNVGGGEDRLGGAKFGTLEQGVLLNVTGLKDDNYRVKLTPSLDAWIPAHSVELLHPDEPPATSLTGSILITGGSGSDKVTLNLSRKLPYISSQEINPNKIIVDVFGATSNTNWKTKHLNSEGIDEVEWRQIENGRFRLIIKLNHSQNWGYSVGYGLGNQLVVNIKRPPVVTDALMPLKGSTIAVDAGHGGSSDGALGAGGFKEKEVTLKISEKLAELLRLRGADVVMTRTQDSTVYMLDRKKIALENDADLLVSIHANSTGYASDPLRFKGTGIFYKHIAFKPLAELMYEKMLELNLRQYGLTGSFNFSLNAATEFPNVLVETAFISNPDEEILLASDEFQEKIARQIVRGLEEYYTDYASFDVQNLSIGSNN